MIKQTLDILISRFGFQLEDITIEDVRIGVFLTAVKLSNDAYGLASTQINRRAGRGRRNMGAFSPLQIKGQKISDLFLGEKPDRIGDSLQVAVLNALSSRVMTSEHYRIVEDSDPIDLLDLSSRKTITIVGAFQSYIRKFRQTEHDLKVLELNSKALHPDDIHYYVPAAEAKQILPSSDIIIITGSTTVNHSLDGLLELVPAKSMVVVTGPTSSYVPDALFQKGVHLIGATRIMDPEEMMQMVGEAASGYYLFRNCAKKITLVNEKL